MTDIFDALKAEFPRQAISWRAQSLNKEGTSAMALAYIDARDVMNRLDEVCGPGGWQDRYEFHGSRTICYLSIRANMDEWIVKADGAGDTDVEAEKGGISDAFKRAAVKWGIGRYLYDLDAPWVDCESYERGGKRYWKRWTKDPWSKVKTPHSAPVSGRNAPSPNDRTSNGGGAPSTGNDDALAKATIFAAKKCTDVEQLRGWWGDQIPQLKRNMSPGGFDKLKSDIAALAESLASPFQEAAE